MINIIETLQRACKTKRTAYEMVRLHTSPVSREGLVQNIFILDYIYLCGVLPAPAGIRICKARLHAVSIIESVPSVNSDSL